MGLFWRLNMMFDIIVFIKVGMAVVNVFGSIALKVAGF
jgi:hypothetical protein